MKKQFGINVGAGYEEPYDRLISYIRQAGFDACFTPWNEDSPVEEWAECIAKEGLIYQSIHAPFHRIYDLWEDAGEAGERRLALLFACLRDCKRAGVPIMVTHPIIGMERHTPTELGVRRFAALVEEAERLGVCVALENLEGEEYLALLMERLGKSSMVGFCWDTGHELCYNNGKDMLALYGKKLVATHLNDNMGRTDPTVNITWHDDAHMLPLDGIADWAGIMHRLRRERYDGILTFELKRCNNPGRHTNDAYEQMSAPEFYCNAYERACRVAALANE
ncbi:MAG: sugar phosphate isomerase/epimerase [Clostridia bacterium]|nr:sugar phosphate isomerase/epimerase [Clostridia bacterium]